MMRKWVEELPGNDGWYHPMNGVKFDNLADELETLGVPADKVEDILTQAYAATADEFGV